MRSATPQRLCGMEAGKKKMFFSVSMTNLRNSSFTLHRADSWTQRKGIYPRQNPEKKDFNPGLITVSPVCFPPLRMGFDSNSYFVYSRPH